MREIKFRAWDKSQKEMIREHLSCGLELNSNFKGNVWVYQQFTGLKDKNGKEIYESDVVKFTSIRPDLNEGKVEWSQDGAYWMIVSKLPLLLHKAENIEVIGNIHENPELLGGKVDE